MIKLNLKKTENNIKVTNEKNVTLDVTQFDPSELLAASLAKCTEDSVRRFAAKNEYNLKDMSVRVDYERDNETKTSNLKVHLELDGDLEEAQIKKLNKIAEKSYISRVLSNNITLERDVHYNGDKINF